MRNRTSLETRLVDCGLGLIEGGNDKRLGPHRGDNKSGAFSEFNILFPALESALNKKNVDWPQQLFIKHGNLFLKLLENRTDSTKLEVDGLVRIF